MAPFGVVLDASVVFPAAIRDTLLRAAADGLYHLYWSDEILEEVRRNLVNSGRVAEGQGQRLIMAMKQAFPEALVMGYEHRIDEMTNDPKDRHVLAVAVVTQARIIVTDNLRDFPQGALAPFRIEAQSADVFLTHLFERAPARIVQIILNQTNALRFPPKTYREVLQSIAKQAPVFAACVLQRLEANKSEA